MFEALLATRGVSGEVSQCSPKSLDRDEAVRAVSNYSQAIPRWMREHLVPVPMRTLFIWPTAWENVAVASIAMEANANCLARPYRLEIDDDVHESVQ